MPSWQCRQLDVSSSSKQGVSRRGLSESVGAVAWSTVKGATNAESRPVSRGAVAPSGDKGGPVKVESCGSFATCENKLWNKKKEKLAENCEVAVPSCYKGKTYLWIFTAGAVARSGDKGGSAKVESCGNVCSRIFSLLPTHRLLAWLSAFWSSRHITW